MAIRDDFPIPVLKKSDSRVTKNCDNQKKKTLGGYTQRPLNKSFFDQSVLD